MAIIDSSLAIVADTETNRNETSRTSQDTAVMLEPGDENQVQTQCQAGNHAEVDMEDAASESSGYEEPKDLAIQEDMERLQEAFPDFREKYRLIKRIGEGTFSTVYKAQDLCYGDYENSWDISCDRPSEWAPPPPARKSTLCTSISRQTKPCYVAIKKIYVTSSPTRILNELELLFELRNCPTVCPLITAFRSTDQVVAVLPYFQHDDFRNYFRQMTVADIKIYFRSLFSALSFVHHARIIHRDIKPTNFLYNPAEQRGVLVDFGLAEREFVDFKPCLCVESRESRNAKLQVAVGVRSGAQKGYPKNDTRPSRRANRAGTRGFRAPEVLFKCTAQGCKIDVWSTGVILLTIMSRRFPFFNSADDVEAMIELTTVFGSKRMRQAGLLHGVMLETDIPTIGHAGFTLEKIIAWSACKEGSLDEDEKLAVRFLERCLDLDPNERISADDALEHEFLAEPKEDDGDDDLDLLQV